MVLLFTIHFYVEMMILQRRILYQRGQNSWRESIKCYILFYVASLATCLIMLKAFFIDIFVICFFGFLWLPQVVKNCRTNTRRAPHWTFVLVITAMHMFVPLYMIGYSHNIFGLRPRRALSILLFCIQALVLLIMALQRQLGARVILPRRIRSLFGPPNPEEFQYFHDI